MSKTMDAVNVFINSLSAGDLTDRELLLMGIAAASFSLHNKERDRISGLTDALTDVCGNGSDAKVYVAAPELLKALKDLVASIENAAAKGIDLTGYIGLGDAHAAIAKAEGAK